MSTEATGVENDKTTLILPQGFPLVLEQLLETTHGMTNDTSQHVIKGKRDFQKIRHFQERLQEFLSKFNATKASLLRKLTKINFYFAEFNNVEWCLQLQQSLWQIETFSPVNTIILEDSSVYHQYLETMESLMEEGDLLEKEQMLVDIVEKIFLQACEPASVKNAPPLQIEQLKLQLSMNLDIDTSMSQIASKLQANPYTLLRQFKAATGITPHAYRLNCRIEHAKKLLQKGFDLSQVALECGFFDQSHFHRHFKAMTTLTPKEYQVNFIQ